MYCDRVVLLADGRIAGAYRADVHVGVNDLTGGPLVLPRPRP